MSKNNYRPDRKRSPKGTFCAEVPMAKAPICVTLPLDADAVVRSIPDRSAFLRRLILKGLRQEGFLPDTKIDETKSDAQP